MNRRAKYREIDGDVWIAMGATDEEGHLVVQCAPETT
jgi:hypothetical protein